MQKINQVIKASQIGKDKQQQKPMENLKRWSVETERLVLGLFTRLADLFGDLAKVKGLEIKKEGSDEYTREFKLWCIKLSDLTANEIAAGIANLERKIEEAVRDNVKVFPPSYSEYRGLCLCGKQVNKYRSWKGLPKSVMSNEERRREMAKVRKKTGL